MKYKYITVMLLGLMVLAGTRTALAGGMPALENVTPYTYYGGSLLIPLGCSYALQFEGSGTLLIARDNSTYNKDGNIEILLTVPETFTAEAKKSFYFASFMEKTGQAGEESGVAMLTFHGRKDNTLHFIYKESAWGPFFKAVERASYLTVGNGVEKLSFDLAGLPANEKALQQCLNVQATKTHLHKDSLTDHDTIVTAMIQQNSLKDIGMVLTEAAEIPPTLHQLQEETTGTPAISPPEQAQKTAPPPLIQARLEARGTDPDPVAAAVPAVPKTSAPEKRENTLPPSTPPAVAEAPKESQSPEIIEKMASVDEKPSVQHVWEEELSQALGEKDAAWPSEPQGIQPIDYTNKVGIPSSAMAEAPSADRFQNVMRSLDQSAVSPRKLSLYLEGHHPPRQESDEELIESLTTKLKLLEDEKEALRQKVLSYEKQSFFPATPPTPTRGRIREEETWWPLPLKKKDIPFMK